ncbi:FHA domain-containing protein [Micromonospora sp. CPCC 206061]|uniref:FHA domain-containing protein n=1 Tax=Micromonospora sp. CPCC 206061 TaxID=3122410 RepID=UPI002FEF70BD
MATCPKGHESGTADYCDVCGARMGGASASAAPAAAVPSVAAPAAAAPQAPDAKTCPVCGSSQTGRFCEEDGYDFLLAPPVGAPPVSTPQPVAAPPAQAAPTTGVWQVAVRADSAYFEVIKAMGGEDAGSLAFPRFSPERRFQLSGEQVVIGRRSRSRGVNPDIDLTGPPEDPGVSHLHALLVAQPDGWAVVDLESANGTYLNDPSSNPLDPNVPHPLKGGDTIYVGAWTALTVTTTAP